MGFRRTRDEWRVRRVAVLNRTASALLALLLGACSSTNLSRLAVDSATQRPLRHTVELSPAQQREHLRILAAYGGSYDDERLQDMLATTVDKLVAASERPDLKYQVTIL